MHQHAPNVDTQLLLKRPLSLWGRTMFVNRVAAWCVLPNPHALVLANRRCTSRLHTCAAVCPHNSAYCIAVPPAAPAGRHAYLISHGCCLGSADRCKERQRYSEARWFYASGSSSRHSRGHPTQYLRVHSIPINFTRASNSCRHITAAGNHHPTTQYINAKNAGL